MMVKISDTTCERIIMLIVFIPTFPLFIACFLALMFSPILLILPTTARPIFGFIIDLSSWWFWIVCLPFGPDSTPIGCWYAVFAVLFIILLASIPRKKEGSN